ncbi:Guanine nucleotide-binding proteinalpha-13 subunit [Aphelenchoides besseyi]|nr:Guanine nucleotide-binding proteinalpha-13 subunit [Aphelenchoides besseyi]
MGLFCSKEKQTANVSPEVNGLQKNTVEQEKRPAEVEEANPASSRPSPRNQTPQLQDVNHVQDGVLETANDVVVNDNEDPVPPVVQSPQVEQATINDDHTDGTRIAIIGSCESGKTTICQQISALCKQSPHEIELRHRPAYINDFLFVAMNQLLKHMRAIGLSLADEDNKKYAQVVETIGERRGRPLMPYESDALTALWEDESIREAYNRRGEINLNDSVGYFFNSIDRIANLDYTPTVEDLIMLYIPSVGISRCMFEFNNHDYLIYDVSGQMLNRKKWMIYYDHFDALIFTLAISEFDQTFENEHGKHSRLIHALNLLGDTASDERFKEIPLVIFLNEVDIFKEKLTRFTLKDFLPSYNGSSSEKDALAYMKQLAVERCVDHQDKLFFYYTTATNNRKMAKVLADVFKKISRSME